MKLKDKDTILIKKELLKTLNACAIEKNEREVIADIFIKGLKQLVEQMQEDQILEDKEE